MVIKVRYKIPQADQGYDDLVCEVTEFMDKFQKYKHEGMRFFCTYLWNDLVERDDGNYQIAFRRPGATRGHIELKRIDKNLFEIVSFFFIEDTCFGNIGCYKRRIKRNVEKYIGEILDFSSVKLMNNKEE